MLLQLCPRRRAKSSYFKILSRKGSSKTAKSIGRTASSTSHKTVTQPRQLLSLTKFPFFSARFGADGFYIDIVIMSYKAVFTITISFKFFFEGLIVIILKYVDDFHNLNYSGKLSLHCLILAVCDHGRRQRPTQLY